MATKNIPLPELGEGVSEGELVNWLVKPGDKISADQTIAEIMTDKATVEVPSPSAGTVKELKFKEGEIVAVGATLLVIDSESSGSVEKGPSNFVTPSKSSTMTASSSPKSQVATASPGVAIKEIVLPELGEGVSEGELVNWLVKPGDKISADQTIAEIMTDKATVEVPSPTAGTVKEIKFKEGDIVAVGKVMLVLETTGTSTTLAATSVASANNGKMAPAPAVALSASGLDVYPPVAGSRVLATPATRRLAREMNIDINQIHGSGLAGRVTRDDVQHWQGAGAIVAGQPLIQKSSAAASTAVIAKPAYQGPAGAIEERVPLKGIRKKIAENMQLYKQIVPHFTLMEEADVTALVQLRTDVKAQAEKIGVKITYLPFVIKSLIATMQEFPMFNASIDDAAQEIVYKKYFNIGFAADTAQGLLVPVIKNADQKTLAEISREIVELSNRARDGKLNPDEMKGATITVTNIGSVGGMYATPIINHPEVAIIGMYKISDKPVLRDGELAFIKSMNFTVTADHRLIDGAVAARFMKAFVGRLENPGALMLDMR
jgi:pyruvate dehydrogenase E2 component (dihydrolipoamide acetyltransferase)